MDSNAYNELENLIKREKRNNWKQNIQMHNNNSLKIICKKTDSIEIDQTKHIREQSIWTIYLNFYSRAMKAKTYHPYNLANI